MPLSEPTDGATRQPIPIERALVRKALGHLCAGIAIITAHDGRRPAGFMCQSVAAVSTEPLYISFCRARNWPSWMRDYQRGAIGVNLLAADQRDICARFAPGGTGKFAGVHWNRGANGAPIFDGALASMEAEIAFEHDAGDHTIVVAQITALHASEYREPLLVYRGVYGRFSCELGLEV